MDVGVTGCPGSRRKYLRGFEKVRKKFSHSILWDPRNCFWIPTGSEIFEVLWIFKSGVSHIPSQTICVKCLLQTDAPSHPPLSARPGSSRVNGNLPEKVLGTFVGLGFCRCGPPGI